MYSYRTIFLSVFIVLCLAYLILTYVIYYRATKIKEQSNEQWLNRRPELSLDATKSTDMTVLGRPLEKADVVSEVGDIFISIKTTSKNHETRLPRIFLTWLMAVWPGQVHIVTDKLSLNEEIYQTAKKIGFHFTGTNCPVSHDIRPLCCKTTFQYEQFYRAMDQGLSYRWFCHFDDDMYVNIPKLVAVLMRHRNESEAVYIGRWPEEVMKQKRIRLSWIRLWATVSAYNTTFYRWGTGAAYCVNSMLMQQLETHFRDASFETFCSRLAIADDMAVGALVEAILGYSLIDDRRINTHLNELGNIPASELRKQITISYDIGKNLNVVNIPNATFPKQEDPTRFLSYHCLLYPRTSWCKKKPR